MKNKYVMSRLLALGMAATLTAGNLPMVANAADETVKVSEATEQQSKKQKTQKLKHRKQKIHRQRMWNK